MHKVCRKQYLDGLARVLRRVLSVLSRIAGLVAELVVPVLGLASGIFGAICSSLVTVDVESILDLIFQIVASICCLRYHKSTLCIGSMREPNTANSA